VQVVAVTLSQQQAVGGRSSSLARPVGQVDLRHSDYRDVWERDFDAISSIGLTEHIGTGQLDAYAAHLASRLRPGGACSTTASPGPTTTAPHPEARLRHPLRLPRRRAAGVGRLVATFSRAGLELRHEESLREHYARTCAAWCRNLDEHWDDAVAEVGLGTARVWALYLAGSQLGFERGRIQLHQLLLVKPDADGVSGMPLRPDWGA
jgi:cyclopropane-fatty-acyl-phospholipid synthase